MRRRAQCPTSRDNIHHFKMQSKMLTKSQAGPCVSRSSTISGNCGRKQTGQIPQRCRATPLSSGKLYVDPVHKEMTAFAPATVANLGPGFDWMGCAVQVCVNICCKLKMICLSWLTTMASQDCVCLSLWYTVVLNCTSVHSCIFEEQKMGLALTFGCSGFG